jgi:hypothetical protein
MFIFFSIQKVIGGFKKKMNVIIFYSFLLCSSFITVAGDKPLVLASIKPSTLQLGVGDIHNKQATYQDDRFDKVELVLLNVQSLPESTKNILTLKYLPDDSVISLNNVQSLSESTKDILTLKYLQKESDADDSVISLNVDLKTGNLGLKWGFEVNFREKVSYFIKVLEMQVKRNEHAHFRLSADLHLYQSAPGEFYFSVHRDDLAKIFGFKLPSKDKETVITSAPLWSIGMSCAGIVAIFALCVYYFKFKK